MNKSNGYYLKGICVILHCVVNLTRHPRRWNKCGPSHTLLTNRGRPSENMNGTAVQILTYNNINMYTIGQDLIFFIFPVSGLCKNRSTPYSICIFLGHLIGKLAACTHAPHREGNSMEGPPPLGSGTDKGVGKHKVFSRGIE